MGATLLRQNAIVTLMYVQNNNTQNYVIVNINASLRAYKELELQPLVMKAA